MRIVKQLFAGGHSQYPSIPIQVANASAAVGRVVKAAAQGTQIMVPIQQAEARQAICLDCSETKRCFACGCYIGLKTRLATEKCPLGKW